MAGKWLIPFVFALSNHTCQVTIMIIMMSMNAYVIMAIILGFTLGYFVFLDKCKLKKGSKKCKGGCDDIK